MIIFGRPKIIVALVRRPTYGPELFRELLLNKCLLQTDRSRADIQYYTHSLSCEILLGVVNVRCGVPTPTVSPCSAKQRDDFMRLNTIKTRRPILKKNKKTWMNYIFFYIGYVYIVLVAYIPK